MDYKRTMHIEFQGMTYLAASDLERRISKAVQVVMEHAAMRDDYDREAYMGDSEITKGWKSDPTADEAGITRRAESERIDRLIEEFQERYDEDPADEELLLAEAERRRQFYLRGGEDG